MPNFQDRVLECSDCGGTFVFTAGEQAFYQERGFSDPRRCPSCRATRRAGRSGGDSATDSRMGSGSDRTYSSQGGDDRYKSRDRAPRQMYNVVCAECGRPAQVPFKPRDDRPVYCKDCYEIRQTR